MQGLGMLAGALSRCVAAPANESGMASANMEALPSVRTRWRAAPSRWSAQNHPLAGTCNPATFIDFNQGAQGDIVRARLTIKTQGWGWPGPVVAKY
jgi:hypothetical protein